MLLLLTSHIFSWRVGAALVAFYEFAPRVCAGKLKCRIFFARYENNALQVF